MHPSFVAQIDGLIYAVFRLRLERDVCGSSTASYCPLFGAGVSASSTYCGLFLSWPRPLAPVAVAVREERGYGVFAGPTSEVHAVGGRILLEFSFPSSDGVAWRAGLVSFAFRSKVRRKRPETFFPLQLIRPFPASVGLLPFCPGRESTGDLVRGLDSSPSLEPLPAFPGCLPMPQAPSAWDQVLVAQWASFFPCNVLARLAVAAASPGGAPSEFSGDRSKRVLSSNMPLTSGRIPQIRAHLIEEVSAGRILGPFPRPPFPNSWCSSQPRNAALGTVPKHKWDPSSDAFRLISNFSAEEPSSVNDLVYTPRVVAFHLQASHIRDILASKGLRPRFHAVDHRKAFRANRVSNVDLHLSCYQLDGEWWVDLYQPFGSVVAEWSYDCIGEVLRWAMYCLEVSSDDSPLCRFVDNFFFFAARDDPTAVDRWRRCTSLLAQVGVDLHEEQSLDDGPVLALGWEWHETTFRCPPGKYDVLLRFIKDWHERSRRGGLFSVHEIERLVGLLGWVSTAAPVIRPLIATARAILFCGRGRRRERVVLSLEAAAAVDLLHSFFLSWDRCAPISMGFSPVSSWDLLIRTDASTDFGAGGFAFPLGKAFVHKWSAVDRTAGSRRIRESTTFFGLSAILLALRLLGPELKGKRVQFECDSEPAVLALCKCYSPELGCHDCIRAICLLCASLHITPRWEHILSPFNSIADALSHDMFSQACFSYAQELGGSLSLISSRR